MTEKEQELQIIEFDKMSIEDGDGFIKWEKNQLYLMQKYSPEEKEKILERIKIIKEWAIEKNMMKSKIERLIEQGVPIKN